MKNFIWDFDGTLFDTYTHTVYILHEYMKELGRNYDYDRLYYLSRINLGVVRKYCEATPEEWQEFRERENNIHAEPRALPYPDTLQTLKYIIEKGGQNFIYTHRDYITNEYIKFFGMEDLFTEIVIRENNFPAKPAPDAILYLIQKYGLDPAHTVMVGDREIDILSGKNAGISACLFTEGNPDTDVTKNTAADWIANNMKEILPLV